MSDGKGQTKGFTPVIDVLVDETDLMTAVVFGKVWRYCQGDEGRCYATVPRIAEECGISISSTQRRLKKLCKMGYLLDTTPNLRNKPHSYRDTGVIGLSTQTIAGKLDEIAQEPPGQGDRVPGQRDRACPVTVTDEDSSKDSSKDIENLEDSDESSPAPKKRTRARSELDVLKSELVSHFTEKSGLPRPPTGTKGEFSAAGKLWWQPLIRIADCVDRDVARAQCLVEWALCHADSQALTVSRPASIEKIAIGELGRRIRQDGRPRAAAGRTNGKTSMTQTMEWLQEM